MTKASGDVDRPPVRLTRAVSRLTGAAALTLVHAAADAAQSRGHAIAVTVVTETGQELATYCMDGTAPQAAAVAREKAYTAATYQMPSDDFLDHTRTFGADGADGAAMLTAAVDRVMLLGGGVPVTVGGTVVGAVGVSGGTGEQDRAAAADAIAAVLSLLS